MPHVGRQANSSMLLVFVVGPGSKVLVPEPVDYADEGEARGDDHKPLVAVGRFGVGDVHVLAALEHALVDAVEADGVGVGHPRDLVELGGHVAHALDLPPDLVDVADVGDPPDPEVTQAKQTLF